ncbi:MAG: GGDEF domain-containing protein, partial [Spirochaetia bacterium]|nr:GGDEF domain-containing protein [Spirochaetia bacterium]
LHIFSVIIFLLNLYGQLWILFESLYGQYVKILWLSGAFIIIFSSQFVRHFLRIKDFSPKLDRLMSSLVLLGFALFVSGLFEFYTFANYTARLTALILPLIYVAAGIQASRKGFKSAGLLFISWIMISVAFCGLAAKGLELPMIHYLSLVSLPAAFAIESVLYSIALANQLRILQEEKEEAIQYGKRFEEMSYTDPLTGFFNRRYFESKLQAEILHSKLMNRPLGLILLDFDNFKMINDTYGHAQGDEVLKQLSKTLLENKRREDTFCRYGGEEFACLLPGSDLQASANIAEKMRKKCESIIFTPKAFIHFKVTVSAGVTTFYPEDTDDTLLERADRLMYKAKESGKNTVVTDQVEPQE